MDSLWVVRAVVSCALLQAVATSAWAVTAEDAWAALGSQFRNMGLALGHSVQRRDGNHLYLAGVFIGPVEASETGYPRALVDRIVLSEQADGSVSVDIPTRLEVELSDVGAVLVLRHAKLAVSVQESGGALRTLFDGERISMSVDYEGSLELPDGSIDLARFGFGLTLQRPEGWISENTGPGFPLSISISAQRLFLDGSTLDPSLGETVAIKTRLDDATVAFSVGTGARAGQPGAASRLAGATVDVSAARFFAAASISTASPETSETVTGYADQPMMRFGAIFPEDVLASESAGPDFLLKFLKAGGEVFFETSLAENTATSRTTGILPDVSSTSIVDSVRLAFRVDEKAMSLDFEQGVATAIASLPATSFPELRLSYGPSFLRASLPTLPSAAPAETTIRLGLEDVRINEEVWTFLDRRKAIPRDPMALRLDVTVIGDLDLLSETTVDGITNNNFEIDAERIEFDEVLLVAGGAVLSGSGSFALAPLSGGTAEEVVPVGSAEISLTGADRLMDAIGSTGLVPKETLADLRARLAANWPDPDGSDRRKGVIEGLADGTTTLNGRRVE